MKRETTILRHGFWEKREPNQKKARRKFKRTLPKDRRPGTTKKNEEKNDKMTVIN